MKAKQTIRHLTAAFLMAGSFPALAASISENTTTSGAGIPYKWEIALSGNDSATVIRHVGAWSWEDNSLFAPGEDAVGWTHTSDWVKLSLSQEGRFTLNLSRETNVAWPSASDPTRTTGSSASFYPSFTIYKGTDIDGNQEHIYNNKPGFNPADSGDLGWATPKYVFHLDNSTLASVGLTLDLPAGEYSIALGSNAASNNAERQGYRAVLSTTVPEPGSFLLLAFPGLALLRRRR